MIELYDNLMAVCDKTEASKFFYKDVTGRYGGLSSVSSAITMHRTVIGS